MSSSGIHDSAPASPVQQQQGGETGGQPASSGSFKEKPVQVVASGEQHTSRSDSASLTQVVGADIGNGVQDEGEYANSFYSPPWKNKDADATKAGSGGSQRHANLPGKADESPYQSLKPNSATRAGNENPYQSLNRSRQTAVASNYENLPRAGEGRAGIYQNLSRAQSGDSPHYENLPRAGESFYQNLPHPGKAGENPYQSLQPRDAEGHYQSLTPAVNSGQGSEAAEYEIPVPSSSAEQRASEYEIPIPSSQANQRASEQDLYVNPYPSSGADAQVQEPADYESIYASVADEGIYSEIDNAKTQVSGTELQNAAKAARKSGFFKPLQNAVKASIKSFTAAKPAGKNEIKTLAKNLRLIDGLSTANGQANATLNKLLSANYTSEQLIGLIKNDPAFLKDIAEFSGSLSRFADDPKAAARIIENLDLNSANQERFASDFHAAANLLKKVYQARFDAQDAGSAFKNFADQKRNPFEQRASQPGFADQDSSRLRNWLAYAVSYFQECSQIMVDSARGEDPEID
ncbi:MAG: hypothetical protein OXC81_02775, partial [Betaproteobacteria bacterium]|nr:hypothetical protein [Betaproteobacteria bacterium]